MRKHLQKILFPFLLILFFAFNFQGSPPSGWYQQFPNTDGATITDMIFTDSLNGYLVTGINGSNNSYILKTTNGGDNWTTKYTHTLPFVKVEFINSNTGFTNAYTKIFKTTNAGENWNIINLPAIFGDDMFVLNQDTIFLAMSESLTGGVFRTTNGGANWVRQLSLGSDNPTSIYFYNKDIGFAAGGVLYKTTNGGNSWFNTNQTGFGDMQFINETTGWKSYGPILKTTDGGLNWVNLPIPQKGGNIALSRVNKFYALNKDTIWGAGAVGFTASGAHFAALLYLTTDGGQTWGYQMPDTIFNTFQYTHIQFTDKKHGWAYAPQKGIHTVFGGDDTTIIVSVSQNQTELVSDFILYQNYPNPFNPVTNFKFQIPSSAFVIIKVFDLQGKEVALLLNERKTAGSYSISFDASKYNLSSGIYFYTLQTDNFKETRKMILVK
jgi:photosystem II stability/assembly factor-like uncharacterized protein